MLTLPDRYLCLLVAWRANSFAVALVPLNVDAHACMRIPSHISTRSTAEISLLVFGVLAAAALAIVAPVAHYELFVALPLLPWAGARFGARAVCVLMMALAAIATVSVLTSIGPHPDPHFPRNALLLVLCLNGTAMLLLLRTALTRPKKFMEGAEQRVDMGGANRPDHANHLGRAVLVTQAFGAFVHELNQPLTSILVNAEAALGLLSRTAAGHNEIREILTDVVQEDRRATEMLRRLRAFVLPEQTSRQRVDLNALVTEVLQQLKSELAARRINVKTELDPMVVPVLTDRMQIEQVLLSLVINGYAFVARDAEQRHELRIATRYLANEQTIEISITEFGSVPPLQHLTGPSDSGSTSHGGMGEELRGARPIAEDLEGRLHAEIRAEGTLVRLNLSVREKRGTATS